MACGFAIVDAFTRSKVGEIAVKAHPQGFQLDEESKRIYANLPKEQAIIVVDYAARKVISEWQMENGSNFPLALRKSTKHVLVAFRDPPKFAAFTFDGSQLANTDTAVMQTICLSIPNAIKSISAVARVFWMYSMQLRTSVLTTLPR